MYQWLVFLHLAGVFGLLASHGVSMVVLFRLRNERDPARVESLLQLSATSIAPFWVSTGVLVAAGTVAGFLGDWWSQGWIWASIATLVGIIVVMYAMARPYYRRVRFIARAMSEGSQAVAPEQFDRILRSGRPWWVAAVGFAGLAFILYLMLFKPSLGLGTSPVAAGGDGPMVRLVAEGIAFTEDRVDAPADRRFSIVFENRDAGVPHNVSVYDGDSPVMQGEVFSGVATMTYPAPALRSDQYRFVCDVHPEMVGTLVVT